MLPIQSLLSITILTIASDVYAHDSDKEHQGPQTCGGRLKGPVGIIQTPNFPDAFPVPIKCKWIIEHDLVNGTISIYFTQQYITSGLTFTEYTYYDDTYKLEERRALTVTEENITKIKWLQVQSPVLVVELNLNRQEGTQLRALGLLSVFGFNMTYAIRAPTDPPGPPSCSAIECRLLGHCYARHDYKEFFCSCFEGYSGVDCGVGPLCPRTSNICKNGGTCRQMGLAAVSCICADGFTGDLCEARIGQPECGIAECSEGCKKKALCDCNPKDADFSSAHYDTRLQVVDQPNVNISQEILKQLTSYLLTSNITLDDEIEILNISSVEASGARVVWVRVWSSRRSAGILRAALARLAATRARTHTLRLLPDTLHFEMQPALSLHALAVNQRPEVWEGSEFILTCMAYGSPHITFDWYKDGVKINFNGTTREIWTRLVSEDALGRRMSVLGISEAGQIDGGVWSCAAQDAGRRRCRAITLTVLTPPSVRLVPSALTVFRGDNVSITCLAGAGRAHGVLGFSWARERSLLPMQPDRHVWEDLYPAGSVLKLYNVQKSSEYRCQVSSVAGTNSAGVWVWALGPDDEACQSEATRGTLWTRTAPGAHATHTCPGGYTGEITRFCEPKTGQHGVKWMVPDFSGCDADSLRNIYERFTRISYGYSWANVSDVTHQYYSVLRSLPIHPGVGVIPLRHTIHMLQYLLSGVAKYSDRINSAPHLLNIYDHLLTHTETFLDEQKIYELQNAIVEAASMKNKFSMHYHSFSVRSESAVHLEVRHAPGQQNIHEWDVVLAHVELAPASENLTIVSVMYHDLGARLPSLRTFTEYKAGRELQYVVCSQQLQVSIFGAAFEHKLQHTITLLFEHSRNLSADVSKLECGLRSMDTPGTWTLTGCDVRVSEKMRVTCRCRSTRGGTIALLTRASHTSTDTEKELRGIVVISVSIGGAMCICACALQLFSLIPAATRGQDILPKLLKATTAVGHAVAMFTLLHCDVQDAACPGALGWVLATCWCISCAALCSQPLLLHAELAERAQRTHSVGLLAGVCVLTCLCARLWGDMPLQVGSAAGAVYSGGIALLTVLSFILAISAHRTLRHVTYKLPPDRRIRKDRSRVVFNTLVLLLTTSAAQITAVTYIQSLDRQHVHVVALSIAALANGLAMLVCYVIRDEECVRAARSALSLSNSRNWDHSPAGDTSLSLYIKQAGEVESRGGAVHVLESCSSPVSPTLSYWRARPLDSPTRINRMDCNSDSRADIVRSVEYKHTTVSPRGCSQMPVCDLIPVRAPQQYRATVCLELAPSHQVVTCTKSIEPYSGTSADTSKDTCTICAKSNPDVSKLASPPIKSCLKKTSRGLTSSTSLPSIDTIKDDSDKPHIEHVNREWKKAYDNPQTDKVLNKISSDLDFLLNRQSNVSHHIEEVPT